MAVIHVLDAETIDKIAAGEVVERPASVVKELVENAIDAKATAVTVEIKDGGIEFVRVTDDGCGMEPEQLRKAFLRHATSKIQSAEDLMLVKSLGFRGEALSSIAAVSRVELITKTKECLTGTRIIMEGAVEKGFEEVGAPEGTTFMMRNLFYNTPVRRKFLKTPSTEGSYVTDLMEHLALSRPDISFRLIVNGQTKFHTSGNGDLRETIYRIYGRDVAMGLIPVQFDQDGICIEGFLGNPTLVRANRNHEIYFINGRFVKSSLVARALEEGYREYLMQHKFPFCVLHIRMDTQKVDVNVHPTKMDVRFSEGMRFSALLCGAVKYALLHKEMIPSVDMMTSKEKAVIRKEEKKREIEGPVPESFEQKRFQAHKVQEETLYRAQMPAKKDFAKSPVWSRIKTDRIDQEQKKDVTTPQMPETEELFVFEDNTASSIKTPDENREIQTVETVKQEGNQSSEQLQKAENGEDIPRQMELFEDKILASENRPLFRFIGQVFDTYWLIEYQDKLLMIDQHAAHEKVNYERMMMRFHKKEVLSQTLMPPIIVALNGREIDILEEHIDVFEQLGFEIESFGGNEYALRAVPVDLYGCEEKQMFLEVLDQLVEGNSFGGIKVIQEKIASMACKASVKGNMTMSEAEAQKLIDELLTLDNPYNCPHGRPTIVAMSKSEMDKKFKRIVT